MPESFITSDFTRVFTIEGRASPSISPVYQGQAKAGTPTFNFGDVTTIRIPNPDRYGGFIRAGKIIGSPGDPELPITARYTKAVSDLLRIGRNGCDNDVQVHIGECQDPRDFNRGWDKVLILEAGRINQWTTDNDLGALGPDERNLLNEQVTFVGTDIFEVVKLSFAEIAATTITQEVIDIVVCDRVNCGSCGIPSDGCDKVFALTVATGGSIGSGALVAFSADGGSSWRTRDIQTLSVSQEPNRIACIGSNIVVISSDSDTLHYAPTVDLLASVEVWTQVSTGFVATHGPRAISSIGPSFVWMAGELGYIYFSSDITDQVVVQSNGSATAQDLNDIHMFDTMNGVAVGASNAILNTRDGHTWALVLGPAPGIVLNAVFMLSADIWFVGTQGGRLFYTENSGATWVEKGFPSSGTGVVKDIKFVSRSVGYMSHTTAALRGRILRTISGGNSWYVLPETTGSVPDNKRINSIATCENANIVFAGGLHTNSLDGIIVLGSP